ncbi:unnamed protein product [Calypogeia fissa]
MKETKHFPARSTSRWLWRSPPRGSRRRVWSNLHCHVGLIILVGISALIIMFSRKDGIDLTGMTELLHRAIYTLTELDMPKQWNYSFEPKVSNWDEQRGRWMKEHTEFGPGEGKRPKVMMVTGSSSEMCDPSIVSHLLLRSGKNKLDYCRMHDLELYYNIGEPDPDFSDWWVKLPVIRMLMLRHPEFEWIWWLDADAILTDMSLEAPFADLEHHNLILYRDDHLVYYLRDWERISTSNFMIRNCQWSLDLLDAWGSMGTTKMRERSGKFESRTLANRPSDFPGDDQSSLVALLIQDQRNSLAQRKWIPSVKLVKETEYIMNGNWTITAELEDLSGMDDLHRVPFVTHFKGCLPACTGELDQLSSEWLDLCREQLERAFDFSDNQVYRQYGFQPRRLGRSLEPLVKTKSEGTRSEETTENVEVYSLPPKVTDWDEKRQVSVAQHPSKRRDDVLLVSGSAPEPCASKAGGHFLLWGFKNRIDYARMNGVSKVFYNMAVIDNGLTGWWSKLPLLKMLMLSNPNTEWIWWMDSDAAFTNLNFQLPFSRYDAKRYNLVMYGAEHEVFDKKRFTGINTGNLLIRNCQWSMDLLDRWASFGATEELRWKNEHLLNDLLSDRPSGWSADDQSVLVYILIMERQKWESRVCLETSFAMSGAWDYCVGLYVDGKQFQDPPFVTHFAGCNPCNLVDAKERCLVGMERTYNFADNQVLELYGLRHVKLNSSKLLRNADGIKDLEENDELTAERQRILRKMWLKLRIKSGRHS